MKKTTILHCVDLGLNIYRNDLCSNSFFVLSIHTHLRPTQLMSVDVVVILRIWNSIKVDFCWLQKRRVWKTGKRKMGLNLPTSVMIRSHQYLSTPQPVELQCKHSGQQKLNVNHNCSCQRWAKNHLLQTWTSYNVSHAHLGAMCSRAWRSQWPRIDSSLGLGASAY